jgi:MFS family permease
MLSTVTLVRSLPRPVRVLVFGTFINRIGTLILPFLSLVLLRDFHFTPADAGLLLSAFGAGTGVSILVGGVLTDRLGRRRTLAISLFGGGVLAMGLGLASSRLSFGVLLVAFAFVSDLYRPAASAMLGDLLPSDRRALGFAALRMAVNLGFAVGCAVGGLLADFNWRLLFIGDGLTTLAFGVLVLLAIPESREPETHAAVAGPAAWRDPVLIQAMLASLFFCLAFQADFTVLPLALDAAGYPTAVFGLLIGINGIVIALLEMPAVDALQGFRRLRVAAIGSLLTALGFGLLALTRDWRFVLLAVLVWTAGEIMSMPQLVAFVSDWAPPEARGRYIALYQATWSLGFALNPVLFIPLRAWLGESPFWLAVAATTLPSVALLLRLDLSADRPERLRGRKLAA